MEFHELKHRLFKEHGISKNRDIANYFKVTDQAVSNWKRNNSVPDHYIAVLNHRRTDNNIDDKTVRMLLDLFNTIGDYSMREGIKKVLFQEKGVAFIRGKFLPGEDGKTYRVWIDGAGGEWERILGYSKEELKDSTDYVSKFFKKDEASGLPIRWKFYEYIGIKKVVTESEWVLKRKDDKSVKILFRVYSDFETNSFRSVVLDYDVLDERGEEESRLKEERRKEFDDLLLLAEGLRSQRESSS